MAENQKQREARLKRYENVTAPEPEQLDRVNTIRDAASMFEKALNENCPPGSALSNAQLAVQSAVRHAERAIVSESDETEEPAQGQGQGK